MAFDKFKKFMGSDFGEDTKDDEYYGVTKDGFKETTGNGNKMILLEPRAFSESQQIADYLKAKKQADSMVTEDSNKEQQLYDLRHEVIESQIKLESSARMIEEYKEQINALQRKIIQLEAEKNRNE